MTRAELIAVMEGTWPAERKFVEGPWTFRQGLGGGKRVCATSTECQVTPTDIVAAEAKMREMGQTLMFTLAPDDPFNSVLGDRGYKIIEPTNFYHCPIDILTAREVPPVTAFDIWPPLQIMRDIWAEEGTGQNRINVMERAKGPATSILGRVKGRAGGVVFAAVHNGCAMIHSLVVLPSQRRHGLAGSLIVAAAHWAARAGATDFALVTLTTNIGVNALSHSLGMSIATQYHYRIKPQQEVSPRDQSNCP